MIKTLCVQCAIAYVICEDPGPILLLEPKEDSCLAFSKRRLTPMIRDNACLRGRLSASFNSTTGSTLLSKDFPGGNLIIVSANTPVDVAQHTIRYVFCDEPDKYPMSAGKEGDPMDLAWERAATFQSRRKRILCCSPTVAGLSRIGKAYRSSDQRRPWVPCPSCGQFQILKFHKDAASGGGGVWFDSSLSHDQSPATARYECRFCSARWTDAQRWSACEKAQWRAEKPFAGVAGFWISHLYSPWKKLSDIVAHFLRAKDDRQQYQVFINTVLAEEWQEEGETPDAERLFARAEPYPHGPVESAVVPQRGLFLTAAVDVQDSPARLEVEVTAWGRNRERWSIGYHVIECFAVNGQRLPVTSRELWDRLDTEILQQSWRHESGSTLPIMAMAIDTGSRPKPVYDFARRHPQLAYSPGSGLMLRTIRTVIPVKGTGDSLKIISSISGTEAARRRQGVRIVGVGTHCAKQEIFDALNYVRPKPDGTLSGAPVSGCYHFPIGYQMSYFNGLCSEVRRVKENGDITYEKKPDQARNEPLDIAVYQRAAAAIVGLDRFNEAQWRQLEKQVQPIISPLPNPPLTTVLPSPQVRSSPDAPAPSGADAVPSDTASAPVRSQPSQPQPSQPHPSVVSAVGPRALPPSPSLTTSFAPSPLPTRRGVRGRFL